MVLNWVELVEASQDSKLGWIKDLGTKSQAETTILSTRIELEAEHFLIRQGKRSSAVISTFHPNQLANLQNEDYRRLLLSISFCSLSDWHIVVEPSKLQIFFNRKSGNTLINAELEHSALPPDLLWKILGVKDEFIIRPAFYDITDSILRKIEFLKRQLVGDINNPNIRDPSAIDHILNTVIFIRFLEDYEKAEKNKDLDILASLSVLVRENRNFGEVVERLIDSLGITNFEELINIDILKQVPVTLTDLIINWIKEFYRQDSQAGYEYDFGLIAEHALGQIYDKYVAEVTDPKQNGTLSFFPELETKLSWEKGTGTLYTPDFIARFLVRQTLNKFPVSQWSSLKIADLACGSGIFLRYFLIEIQRKKEITGGITSGILSHIEAVDINRSAISATKLSVALATYKFTGELIRGFEPKVESSLSASALRRLFAKQFDLIIMNPPFKGWEKMEEEERKTSRDILDGLFKGKIDYSLSFFKVAFDRLKDGGYIGIILPGSFLDAEYASRFRHYFIDNSNIQFIAKFDDYTIFQRGQTQLAIIVLQKNMGRRSSSKVEVLYCRSTPDLAIRGVEMELFEKKPEWEYFTVDARKWGEDWPLLPFDVANIMDKFYNIHPKLSDIFEIRQGIKIGRRKAFIVDDYHMFTNEQNILKPIADNANVFGWQIYPDKRRLIYAYHKGDSISAKEMNSKYSKVMEHLKTHKASIASRSGMQGKNIWDLVRPRDPNLMFRKKIISTSFGLPGNYAFDIKGKYVVTDGNMLIPKTLFKDEDAWYFYLAILNSKLFFKFVARMSKRLMGGQYDLSNRYIKDIPIPRYEGCEQDIRKQIVEFGKKVHQDNFMEGSEEFDKFIISAFQLNMHELEII